MKKIRLAVPTKGHDGLEDAVSRAFGKALTFTIIDVEGEEAKNVQVLDSPAASYDYGSGPVVVKTLVDLGVNMVVACELGPGASGLLDHHNVRKILVEPGAKVSDCLAKVLAKMKTEQSI